jgi:hypothetical protein
MANRAGRLFRGRRHVISPAPGDFGSDGLGRAGVDELGEIPTHGAFHERHFVFGRVAVRIAWPEEVPMAAQATMDLITWVETRQLIHHHGHDRAGGSQMGQSRKGCPRGRILRPRRMGRL